MDGGVLVLANDREGREGRKEVGGGEVGWRIRIVRWRRIWWMMH